MIDYELTAEQKEFGRHMQRLCREEIAPGASALAYGTEEAIRGFLPGQLQKLAAGKYLDILVAGDFVTACVAGEELAKSCPSTFLAAMSSGTAFGRTVAVFGSDAQRARYAEAIKKGEIIGAVACTEASGGSDIGGIVTTARREEGGWVLDGAKDLVTNAPMAHAFLVLAWTDQGAGVEQGLSFFVVERDTPGLTIGQTLETMGLRGAPTAGITLADCRLPAEALLGEEGGGYGIFRNISEWLNLSMSAFALGVGMACMEAATRHGKQRQAFGRPIGHFEGVGAKLAIMFTYNDLGRMLTLRAAWAVDRGEEDAAVLAACAKLFTSEAVNKIANLAMQVHGGHGYLKGMDVERLYRDARFAELAYGTTEMQRAFIAKDGLARYR